MTVRDEGRGIPHDQQERIFTKFFRGDAGSTGITGTGLGLAIVKHALARHQAALAIESTPGAGSRFSVRCLDRDLRIAADIQRDLLPDGTFACDFVATGLNRAVVRQPIRHR